jgi:hypothetical protein
LLKFRQERGRVSRYMGRWYPRAPRGVAVKVSEKQIEQMAAAVVSGLLEKSLVAPKGSRAELERMVQGVIAEDLAAEDALDQEVERLLAPHASKLDEEGGDYRKMFNLLKQKLARERGVVL